MKASNPSLMPISSRFDTCEVFVDDKMAQSILDRLGYTLQDLSLEYGDVVIPDGDISHQLYYGSEYSSTNLMGYIWVENDIYYVKTGTMNHLSPELAALELLPRHIVIDTAYQIQDERMNSKDYF